MKDLFAKNVMMDIIYKIIIVKIYLYIIVNSMKIINVFLV